MRAASANQGVLGSATRFDGSWYAARTMLTRIHLVFTGLLGLGLVLLRARGRLRGAYWTWRKQTAFGGSPSEWPAARERRRAMLDFGAWVWAMRRL